MANPSSLVFLFILAALSFAIHGRDSSDFMPPIVPDNPVIPYPVMPSPRPRDPNNRDPIITPSPELPDYSGVPVDVDRSQPQLPPKSPWLLCMHAYMYSWLIIDVAVVADLLFFLFIVSLYDQYHAHTFICDRCQCNSITTLSIQLISLCFAIWYICVCVWVQKTGLMFLTPLF